MKTSSFRKFRGRKFTPKPGASIVKGLLQNEGPKLGETKHFRLRIASEESGNALFHHNHAVANSSWARFFFQQLQRLIHGLVRQAERAVVHGHHPAGIEIKKGPGSVGGISVNIAERRWIVGSNGEQREFRGQAPADFAKACKVSSVASVVDRVFACLQNKATIA